RNAHDPITTVCVRTACKGSCNELRDTTATHETPSRVNKNDETPVTRMVRVVPVSGGRNAGSNPAGGRYSTSLLPPRCGGSSRPSPSTTPPSRQNWQTRSCPSHRTTPPPPSPAASASRWVCSTIAYPAATHHAPVNPGDLVPLPRRALGKRTAPPGSPGEYGLVVGYGCISGGPCRWWRGGR